MAIRLSRRGGRLLTAIGALAFIGGITLFDVYAQRATQPRDGAGPRGGFEVWLADQSDTRPGFGGQLLIYEGTDLMDADAATAAPIARLDLGAETADLCRATTGRNPVRPHMVAFNKEHTHAVLSFVASGHVVIFDAEKRAAISCFQTTIGSTGTRQAHAAFASPDGTFILIANQNGKRLERIDADFATNTFAPNPAATLDLLTCKTPDGAACEDPALRPINWPICPIIDASSRLAFVTLRGGGLFVVNTKTTPMTIAAEYDRATVKGNGCGGIQIGSDMFINSGGSPVNVSSGDPHHPTLYGFDVYRFPTTGFDGPAPLRANTPPPQLVLTKTGTSDSHGTVATQGDKYLWVLDRHENVAEIVEVDTGAWVGTVNLFGDVSADPAPDLADRSPSGNRLFVALRGPVPLSGDPHNATGSTPGLGIIQVTAGGRDGKLIAVVPLSNALQQTGQAPDAHGLRVRERHR
jgi:hypothetical protein